MPEKPINTVTAGFFKTVDPVWQRSGVFTRSLSSWDGTRRDAAGKVGFNCVSVQLANTELAPSNEAELQRLKPEFQRRGWPITGWATFGQGTDPFADGQTAANRAIALLLAGWIANGELWAEKENAWKSQRFVEGWRSGCGARHIPLMLSCLSSVTGAWARSFDYSPFLAYSGCAVSPQVYCASNALYTLPAMRMSFGHAMSTDFLIPTLNVEKGKPVPTRYKRWRGPRWLWTGEDCEPSQYPLVFA